MLYTGKGDNGTTKLFSCNQSMSKSSVIAEALGCLDELNSWLGVVKVFCQKNEWQVLEKPIEKLLEQIQQDLFIIQAEVAGADKHLATTKITFLENLINTIEPQLPPIKSFIIAGGSELSANFDFTRSLVRRTERRVVLVSEENLVKISPETLSYLNRLSSLFYTLARFANKDIVEATPQY